MKVSIIGGGSFSTPALFAGMRGEFAGCEFVLAARSERHLPAVARACRELAGANGPRITPVVCDAESSGAALAGADVVLIQVRIGNLAGRSFDESFPLRFGLCGDEGLGAGGVSAAWRAWPPIARWLEAIRHHAPRALVLMMSSPVGILTRAAAVRFPDLHCLGICEVPYVALRDMAALLQVGLNCMTFDYVGVNHIGWLHAVRSAGRDLVAEWALRSDRTDFGSRELIERWGGIPTKYLRLHFRAAEVLVMQKAAPVPRAVELESLQLSGLPLYSTADTPQLRQLVGRREAPWYRDAVVPLLLGLSRGEAPGPFFLSGANRGHQQDFASDDILEIGCRIENGAIRRIDAQAPPPPRIAAMISAFCLHERLATEAVLSRQPSLLQNALQAHPWIAREGTGGGGGGESRLASDLAQVIVVGNEPFETVRGA